MIHKYSNSLYKCEALKNANIAVYCANPKHTQSLLQNTPLDSF